MQEEDRLPRARSLVGTVLGRYALVRLLGVGGMGAVYEATHLDLGRRAAIKTLHERYGAEPIARQRFLQEGRAAARIRHANVADVYDVGIDGEHPYLVMELLEGESLARLITREAPFSVQQTADLLVPVVAAVAAAHDQGVVHRDLKPDNIFLCTDRNGIRPKVLDFGISKLSDPEPGLALTGTGVLLGTPHYMSPEQAQCDQDIDARSDQYSLGVLMYECVTGCRPMQDAPFYALLYRTVQGEFPPPRQLLPRLPVPFEALILQAMARRASSRFPTARALGAALLAYGSDRVRSDFAAELAGERPAWLLATAASLGSVRAADERQTGSAPESPGARSTQPVATRPTNNLPQQSTAFVGREAELEQLAKLIADPNVRLMTILAPGGMGKSRLAVEVGRRLGHGLGTFREVLKNDEIFRRGIFFVDLAPLASPDLIPFALAEAVGFRFGSGSDHRRQLIDYFREKSLLLLMDNFEHLTAGVAIVNEILEAAPGIKVLATSRERLGLSAETAFVLDGLGLPETVEGNALASSAMQLFMHSARRVRWDFDFAAEVQEVGRICRLVQGMPLGIVLAASWVAMLAAREIADEISKNLDFLEVDLSDVPKRQQSMRVVFDYSWRLLSEEERAVLSRLSVFRGGFTRAAAEVVAETGLPTLAALMNKSLLRREPRSARYEIQELLRQYAEAQLRRVASDFQATCDRHARHYARVLGEQWVHLNSANQPRALEELDADISNLRSAWRWMLEHRQLDNVGTAIEGLSLYYELRASRAEPEEAFRGVVEAFTHPGQAPTAEAKRIISRALSAQIECCIQLGRYHGLRELISRAIALPDEATHRKERALALVTAAAATKDMERAPQVAAWAEEGLALYRATDDHWGLARALVELSRRHHVEEDHARAETNLRESIAIQQSFGDGTIFIPLSLIELGYTRAYRGYRQEGLRWVLDGLALAERFGDAWSIMLGVYHLALVRRALGDHAAAEAAARRCLALRRESGNRFAEARAHIVLGDILKDQGRLAEAVSHYRTCLENSAGDAFTLATGQLNLGDIALLDGRCGEARELLKESLRLFDQAEIRWGVILASENLGYLACEEGEYGPALERFRHAFQTALAVKTVRFVGSTAAGVALVLLRTDQTVLAAELLGLAKHHPATEHFTRSRRIDPLLLELSPRLSEADLSAALERGRTLDLEAVLHRLSL